MKLINYSIAILATIFIYTWFDLKELPNPGVAVNEIYQDPIQTDIKEENFNFIYRDTEYRVKPMTDYEIWGMITTHNNINAWYNLYHDENSVNFKDVCLAWGDNIESGVYQNIKFTSGEWTCYYEMWGEENINKFNPLQVSNSHLITNDEQIQKTINKMRKGDQIYIRGKLVGYAKTSDPDNMYRMTSLVRDDDGCEIIYVEEAKILKRGKILIYTINQMSKYGIYSLLLISLLIFFVKIFKKPSYIEKE